TQRETSKLRTSNLSRRSEPFVGSRPKSAATIRAPAAADANTKSAAARVDRRDTAPPPDASLCSGGRPRPALSAQYCSARRVRRRSGAFSPNAAMTWDRLESGEKVSEGRMRGAEDAHASSGCPLTPALSPTARPQGVDNLQWGKGRLQRQPQEQSWCRTVLPSQRARDRCRRKFRVAATRIAMYSADTAPTSSSMKTVESRP